MRKTVFIFLTVFIFFLFKFALYNFFPRWLQPNLLVILVIFFNSCWGVRYGLTTALFAGLLEDSFGVGVFGVHTLSFMICAYATVGIRRYFYELEVGALRALTTFLISLLFGLSVYVLTNIFGAVSFREAFRYIIFPDVVSTTILGFFIYDGLRQCVLKFLA